MFRLGKKVKKLGLVISVGIFAALPILAYYSTIHYLLLPPITAEGIKLGLALGLVISPVCVFAASFITMVWYKEQRIEQREISSGQLK